jgi:hypothetical protein
LDPRDEITTTRSAWPHDQAVRQFYALLRGRDLTRNQALEIVAHLVTESAWFQRDMGFNPAGWKANETWANNYRAHHHNGPPWWRREGHSASGDPEWCFYRAFASYGEFLDQWMPVYCPRPGSDPRARYAHAGGWFWLHDAMGWFAAILAAGYRGPDTQAHPEHSLDEHASILRTIGPWCP